MPNSDPNTVVMTREKEEVATPKLWAILFRNDDFTPVDFVEQVLVEICKLSLEEAQIFTMRVHEDGAAACGRWTKDIASTKVGQITTLVVKRGHPLMVQPVPLT